MNGFKTFRELAYPVVFMCAVTFVFISFVSLAHLLTRDAVARSSALFLQRAVVEAAGDSAAGDPQTIGARFAARVRPEPDAEAPRYYRLLDGGEQTQGYAFLRTAAGLWGAITAVVGMDSRLERFLGVFFVEHNETPGLGARITEPWFREQFRGRTGPFTLVAEDAPAGPGEMQAITGATTTSRAVRDMLNTLLSAGPELVNRPH